MNGLCIVHVILIVNLVLKQLLFFIQHKHEHPSETTTKVIIQLCESRIEETNERHKKPQRKKNGMRILKLKHLKAVSLLY